MKNLTVAVFACCLSLAAGGVYAQEMKKDAMEKGDMMKKDAMGKGDMAKDMHKGEMAKDKMSKDAMKKGEMSGMMKDEIKK